MSLCKTIEIDGKPVKFRASAAIPRIYRIKFQRDIYKDLRSLEKSVKANDEDNSGLDLLSLEMFENIAYVMAKHADPEVPDTPEIGWTGLTPSPSIKSCRKSSTCGVSTCRRNRSLKKTSPD